MKSKAKKIIIATVSVLAALVLLAVGYFLYVVISYHRIDDMQQLEIVGNAEDYAPQGEVLSLVTYNVGFGAYSDDYSFFMDGGEHSRAYSKEAVMANINGALNAVMGENPDFVVLQEVDIDGTRSHHVNQAELFANGFSGFDRVFGENYDSPYFLYPFFEPIGANQSGLLSMSRYNAASSVRRSLPIEDSFYKYLDLDRAYTVTAIPTDGDRALMLYNVHLSAYTSDGTIADEQLKMLSDDMLAEYEKGNYVIAAGDFNKDLLGDSSKYFVRPQGDEFNWAKPFDGALLPSGFAHHTGSNVPTCRNADSAFKGDGSDFILSVDGVIVSPNVIVNSCKTVDTGFKFSDHNPVKLEFVLSDE